MHAPSPHAVASVGLLRGNHTSYSVNQVLALEEAFQVGHLHD